MKRGALENIAYKEIKNAIVTGGYPPGAQVVEDVIATQLNMSRSPVRIAMKRLQAEGFLERHDNKRIYVTIADQKRTLDALYIREALEGMAARLAAEHGTQEDKEQLRDLVAEMEARLKEENIFELYQLGIEMHKKIFHITQNVQLERLGINTLEQESVFSYRSLQQSLNRAVTAHEEHVRIATYVIEGDGDQAEKEARQHIHQLIDRVMKVQIPNSETPVLVYR